MLSILRRRCGVGWRRLPDLLELLRNLDQVALDRVVLARPSDFVHRDRHEGPRRYRAPEGAIALGLILLVELVGGGFMREGGVRRVVLLDGGALPGRHGRLQVDQRAVGCAVAVLDPADGAAAVAPG